MSTHRACGADIVWVKHNDTDRYMPPLEVAGPAYIIDSSGAGIQVMTYQTHHCDVERMEAWQEYKARISQLNEDSSDNRIEARRSAQPLRAARKDEIREKVYEEASKVDCPKCNASVGEPCFNLNPRKSTQKTTNFWPHAARRAAAAKRHGV